MLCEALQQWLPSISKGLEAFYCSNFGIVFLFLCAAYVAWSIWTFTILPRLYPDRPSVLPYWIPCKSFFIPINLGNLLIQMPADSSRYVVTWYQRGVNMRN